MTTVRLADLTIRLENRYPYTETLCRDYLTDDSPTVTVSVTREEIAAEGDPTRFDAGYLESIALYRKLVTKLLPYHACLLHAATLSLDDEAFAFSADSGVGKSTHLQMWKRQFGDRVTVINGDKPLVRVVDGEVRAYGTPWCGKEGEHTNRSAPLKAICFLERGTENRITRLTDSEAIPLLLSQVLRPQGETETAQLLETMDILLRTVRCYRLSCTPDPTAAQVAFDGMKSLDTDLKR